MSEWRCVCVWRTNNLTESEESDRKRKQWSVRVSSAARGMMKSVRPAFDNFETVTKHFVPSVSSIKVTLKQHTRVTVIHLFIPETLHSHCVSTEASLFLSKPSPRFSSYDVDRLCCHVIKSSERVLCFPCWWLFFSLFCHHIESQY